MKKKMMKKMLMMMAALMLSAPQAGAVPLTLDFEGLNDLEQILNFYNGGTGSQGSSGTNHGIAFGTSALALIDSDNGGSGNFANEPTPNTIAFFLSGGNLIMDVAAGFTTGFSFFYSTSVNASVTVYDGANGTGNVLGSVPILAASTPLGGCGGGDPTGSFSCWAPSGVLFGGTALSASFAGTANQTGFDSITLGSDTPGGGQVPEPASMTLLGTGLVVAWRKRRQLTARS